MSAALPYMVSTGLIAKILNKLMEARRPERFTQDFLETKLGFSGGSAMAMIPLLKRIGFLNSDGTPTALYDQFRNADTQGSAMAQAMKIGYKELYDANEYAHDLAKEKLTSLVTQLTGAERDSRATQAIVMTFSNLKQFADFEAKQKIEPNIPEQQPLSIEVAQRGQNGIPPSDVDLRLSYTINLNLPESTNPEVFNAIFKALKENLLTGKP